MWKTGRAKVATAKKRHLRHSRLSSSCAQRIAQKSSWIDSWVSTYVGEPHLGNILPPTTQNAHACCPASIQFVNPPVTVPADCCNFNPAAVPT